jgi:prophage regulatory protein
MDRHPLHPKAHEQQLPPLLLSMRQLTARLGLSRATLYRLLRAGRFPAPVCVGRRRLWTPETVQAWRAGLPTVPMAPAALPVAPAPAATRPALILIHPAATTVQSGLNTDLAHGLSDDWTKGQA